MPRSKQARRWPRAFTLVELLVVLALIILLAALITPTFMRVRARAGERSCGSNLRQLYHAVAMYAADNGGYLPPFTTSIDLGGAGGPFRRVDRAAGLIGALRPYSCSAEIWFCPADPFARRIDRTPPCERDCAPRHSDLNHRLTSYLTSDWWYGATSRVDRLFRPVLGRTPLDVSWWDLYQKRGGEVSDTLLMHDMLDDTCSEGGPPGAQAAYSHNGRFNFLYFDGHVHSGCWNR